LELEHANLRAVLSWGLAGGEMVLALRLGCALERFWKQRGYGREGYTWMTQLLSRSEGVIQTVRAQALLAAGRLAYYAYEQGQREALCEESLQLFRTVDDIAGMAAALKELGCLVAQRGRRVQARGLLTESVALYRRADARQGYVEAILCLAEVLYELAENAEARVLAEEGLCHFRREGDRRGMAKAQALFAFIFAYFQKHRQALALAEESLAYFREIDDQWEMATQLRSVAELALRQNEIEQARVRAEESLGIAQRVGHRETIAGALYLLAQIHQRRGSSQHATELFEQSRALYQESGNQEGVALILHAQAHTAFYRRNYDMARRLHEQALRILLTCEHRPALIQSLIELSRVVAVQGQVIWATWLLGASDTLREAIGRKPTPPQDAYRRIMAISSTPLSEQNFMAAWKEGCTMTPHEAFDAQNRLRSFTSHLSRRERRIPPPLHLTGREVEVLRLMTTGLTNPQIAAQLTISPVTVNTHVRSIYNKMGVASRSAATRYALEHHLI
jgi:DNA-binding CsgD family transcriptional regulator/tetratricopeptide (TPR) repeat protein